ncbi:hypothetical protein FHQ28_06445 [Pasteurellaceae bacterium USgator11]|nr:hypothetical protein FHQ19_09775 [Pasteurellaceae bacterium UScroc12]TNG94702.1 hypothetical protein FHQ20_08260 [Pasteurellaceae bacterium USgator41]TNG98929.1 hypothetical protein FHQ24_07330 [Pasteurellaceae bacterium UScroc31]TNH01228.1 hypothetical protein FHQ28_06445 [Pasteurellaceae bacterium USgator11]
MPIVVVNTDFVIHKEDEHWTSEELAMLDEQIAEDKQGEACIESAPEALLQQVAERLSNGDLKAWELLDAYH